MSSTWFMRSEPIVGGSEGVNDFSNYLINPNHKNHKGKTSNIFTTFGDENIFRQNCIVQGSQVNFKNQQSGKGGRPMKSFAQSFMFSLPPGVPVPTQEQWKQISDQLVLVLVSKLQIPFKHAEKYVFSNVHIQDNPHMNVGVCKARNGVVFTDLQRNKIIKQLKTTFTTQYELLTGFSCGSYERIDPNRKDYLPKPKYEAKKKKKKEEAKKQQVAAPLPYSLPSSPKPI